MIFAAFRLLLLTICINCSFVTVFVSNLVVGAYSTGNESINLSLVIVVQICGNNRHFSVCVAICYRQMLVA